MRTEAVWATDSPQKGTIKLLLVRALDDESEQTRRRLSDDFELVEPWKRLG